MDDTGLPGSCLPLKTRTEPSLNSPNLCRLALAGGGGRLALAGSRHGGGLAAASGLALALAAGGLQRARGHGVCEGEGGGGGGGVRAQVGPGRGHRSGGTDQISGSSRRATGGRTGPYAARGPARLQAGARLSEHPLTRCEQQAERQGGERDGGGAGHCGAGAEALAWGMGSRWTVGGGMYARSECWIGRPSEL